MKLTWLSGLVFALVPMSLSANDLLPPERPINIVIDHYVGAALAADAAKIQPADLIDDTHFIRRVTLDLAGRIPTPAEAREYAASTAPQKVTLLVDRLLDSPDFAFHQRNELHELLLAGRGGSGEWENYLLAASRQNRAWDRMFRQMLTGREENAALTFLKVRAQSVDDLVVETSSIFFGVNVSCAKCHDHPLVPDWRQDHFYGMLSFFSRTYLTKADRLAENYSGTVKFKTTKGEEKTARFMFLTGTLVEEPKVDSSNEQRKKDEDETKRQMSDAKAPPPKAPDFSPRAKLVELALRDGDNRFFSRAIVNRVWARLLGRGIVQPLDQMHSGNAPSHAQLLDWLARDLVANGYDLKRLIRGIVLSDTYARSSRWEGQGDPPAGKYFAVAVPRVLSPKQYSLSLLIATASPASLPGTVKPSDWPKHREQLENASNSFAGSIERPGENFQVSVEEALLFSNDPRIENDFLRESGDKLVGTLTRIENSRMMIEAACRSVLSRPPEPDEVKVFEELLSKRPTERLAMIRQMVWALITSPELRFNF